MRWEGFGVRRNRAATTAGAGPAARDAQPTALVAVPRLCESLWSSLSSTVERRGVWAGMGETERAALLREREHAA